MTLALRLISGFDWTEPTTLPISLGDDRAVNLKGLRVAVHTNNGIVPATDETRDAVLAAAKTLEEAGAIGEEIPPPEMEEAWQIMLEHRRYCGEAGAVNE